MDENKEFEKQAEEIAEEVAEAAEEAAEVVEEAAEAVEEVSEEVAEEISEAAEEIAEEAAETAEETAEAVSEVFEQEKKKCSKGGLITAIVVIILAVFCILLGLGKFPKIYNKYNHMGYVNITGRTLADIAEESGMTLDELLEEYNLPANMPANTQESAAYYMMPVKSIAAMYGMTFEDMKAMLDFGDDVTEDTVWGKAEGEVTLEKYIGEDNFEDFKEKYGFGDEITLETKWKEVRKTVDLESKRLYDEQKATEEEEDDWEGDEEAFEEEEEPEAVEETEEAAE